ncbi:hypothetical protein Ari01nite_48050 [Paractinoplanes rishiriensis]|uniref:Uncharacterized protein n=2 Tax=Paractinoplanes rishiriensis TaxID=1050105 RepID=A0A919MYQ7_9ACTN|nr:hypothetical protein Ari01nite_48050 [Actinoplanes rishiriensis]
MGMTTAPLAHTDVIVLDYLAALWAQSEDLSPELRDELMSTVADYIAARRASAVEPIEDAASIIGRLGPPESLVAAARRGNLPPHIRLPALIAPPPVPRLVRTTTAGGAPEYAAIGLLTAGAVVLPVISPVAGMLMVTASPHWTVAAKATGWIVTAGSCAAAAMLMVFLVAAMPFYGEGVAVLMYLLLCGGSVGAGIYLLNQLRRGGQAG